jgi:hypothetical protein
MYITEDNKQICPITGYPVEESDIYPTNQIRMGTEYIFFITDYQIAVGRMYSLGEDNAI